MTSYQVHPDSFSSIELRDGESIDSYIAIARGFSSTAEFREYRSASPSGKRSYAGHGNGITTAPITATAAGLMSFEDCR